MESIELQTLELVERLMQHEQTEFEIKFSMEWSSGQKRPTFSITAISHSLPDMHLYFRPPIMFLRALSGQAAAMGLHELRLAINHVIVEHEKAEGLWE